jgi:hypothetical protein
MPNLPRVMLRTLVRVVAWTLILLVALAAPGVTPRADGEASHVQPTRTAKERLGGKASDEQRVDNCKVPLDLRGPKPRPDERRRKESQRPNRDGAYSRHLCDSAWLDCELSGHRPRFRFCILLSGDVS